MCNFLQICKGSSFKDISKKEKPFRQADTIPSLRKIRRQYNHRNLKRSLLFLSNIASFLWSGSDKYTYFSFFVKKKHQLGAKRYFFFCLKIMSFFLLEFLLQRFVGQLRNDRIPS